MHPSGLREAKNAATRKALARAVLRLSTRDGIDHVTIDAVAAEANVSVRTFHNYFAGKEDALLHFVDTLLDSVIERIEARPAGESFWCSVRAALIETATSPDVGEPAEIVALLRLLDTDPGLAARSRDMDLDQTVEARLTQLYARRGQRADAMYPPTWSSTPRSPPRESPSSTSWPAADPTCPRCSSPPSTRCRPVWCIPPPRS